MMSVSGFEPVSLGGRDLLSLGGWSSGEFGAVLDRAAGLKASPRGFSSALAGKHAVLLFEKPSLRTRVSFEVGIAKLGGHALFYDTGGTRIGQRESIHDYAKNLERYSDVVIARVFSHEALVAFARACDRPVINALSDRFHPCQGIADALTIREWAAGRGRGLDTVRVAFAGEGNNVCHSLMLACAKAGVGSFVWAGPSGREPAGEVVALARDDGLTVETANDMSASAGADVVYTDTWVSMGDESEGDARRGEFRAFSVDEAVMARAAKGAIFMHCMPAHRGAEVTDAVIDSPASVVFDQAENRMWGQMGLLLEVLG